MKKILTILILIFTLQTPSQADDIRDFEIEGMSIGDSLLDYLSEEEIKEKLNSKLTYYYKNKKFAKIGLKKDSFKIYEELGITIKPNEKVFKIYVLAGEIYFRDNNVKECYSQQKEIVDQLKDFLGDNISVDSYEKPYVLDKTGDSRSKVVDLWLTEKTNVRVICYALSKKLKEDNNWEDSLHVIINGEEFIEFLRNEAYQ